MACCWPFRHRSRASGSSTKGSPVRISHRAASTRPRPTCRTGAVAPGRSSSRSRSRWRLSFPTLPSMSPWAPATRSHRSLSGTASPKSPCAGPTCRRSRALAASPWWESISCCHRWPELRWSRARVTRSRTWPTGTTSMQQASSTSTAFASRRTIRCRRGWSWSCLPVAALTWRPPLNPRARPRDFAGGATRCSGPVPAFRWRQGTASPSATAPTTSTTAGRSRGKGTHGPGMETRRRWVFRPAALRGPARSWSPGRAATATSRTWSRSTRTARGWSRR